MSLVDTLSRFDVDPSAPPEPVKRAHTGLIEGESGLDADLEDLTALAMRNAREILTPPVDFDEPKQVSAKIAVLGNILTAQVRVDEGRLKRRKLDALPELLKLIAHEEGLSRAAQAGAVLIEG